MKNYNKRNIFQATGRKPIEKTTFDLGHEVKMSAKIGRLTPILCQEVLPGDHFNLQSEIFMRLMPLATPAMHRIIVYTHFFFVPNRVVWNEWEDFLTGGDDGTATPLLPYIEIKADNTANYLDKGSLADYFGIPYTPSPGGNNNKINALPFRAYQRIYNDYYRDQNLIDKVVIPLDSGAQSESESVEMMTIRNRCWEKDYFTSALPFAQKGDPVQLPLGTTAPATGTAYTSLQSDYYQSDGTTPISAGNAEFDGGKLQLTGAPDVPAYHNHGVTVNSTVDLASATAATINDLREAFTVQQYLEALARGGSRYKEWLLQFFGVKTSDARLDRAEYLGGGSCPIIISEVLQQSQTDTTPLGTMAGKGIAGNSNHSFSSSFEEHGWVIGIMSVLPRTAYSQGMPKQFRKFSNLEYGLPMFAHLGEQEVKNEELFMDWGSNDTDPNNEGTFGYQSRYAEYRYIPSRVAGEMGANLSLENWHLARKFSGTATLNDEFVTYDNSLDNKRIFVVEDPNEDELIVQIYNNLIATRCLPYDASPGLNNL